MGERRTGVQVDTSRQAPLSPDDLSRSLTRCSSSCCSQTAIKEPNSHSSQDPSTERAQTNAKQQRGVVVVSNLPCSTTHQSICRLCIPSPANAHLPKPKSDGRPDARYSPRSSSITGDRTSLEAELHERKKARLVPFYSSSQAQPRTHPLPAPAAAQLANPLLSIRFRRLAVFAFVLFLCPRTGKPIACCLPVSVPTVLW